VLFTFALLSDLKTHSFEDEELEEALHAVTTDHELIRTEHSDEGLLG
jgi:hypothetical protein